jgi:large subunit ribosomal protein L15
MKGQNSRSGGGVRPGFEGGQLPIIKRLPHLRGFTSRTDNEFSVVNVDRLARFPANSRVTVGDLVQAGLIRDARTRVKILGRGTLEAPLSVEAHRVTPSAREKIEKAGGTVVEIA